MGQQKRNNCFVLMPFAPSFDGIWETVIRPTVERRGDECIRADDIFAVGSVLDDILDSIRAADYLIADLTGHNPNVYYELGHAHSLDKPVVLLTQRIRDTPFDLRQHRIIEYADTAAGAEQLKSTLDDFLSNL